MRLPGPSNPQTPAPKPTPEAEVLSGTLPPVRRASASVDLPAPAPPTAVRIDPAFLAPFAHDVDLVSEDPSTKQSSQEGVDMRIEPSGRGLDHALSAVNPEVRQALVHSHETLTKLGIPHVLIGGLAVGAHGYAYATTDVDYLVPEKSAFEGGLVITFKPGVPIKVGRVGIDYLVPDGPANVLAKMQECMDKAVASPGEVTYVPSDLLTYMKLKAGRAKDIGAVVELLKTGMDVDDARAFLKAAGNADVLARFEKCARMAEEEV